MTRLTLALTAAAQAALLSAPALAHEGHAAARETGLLHWLTETDHLAALASAVVVLALARTAFGRSRRG